MQQYHIPTEIKWGRGLASKTGELIRPFSPTKVLIVTDPGVRAAGLIAVIEESFEDEKIPYTVFDQVEPNPSSDVIHRGYDLLKENDCNIVVSIGGGSSIDTAKGIAALATNSGRILDYEGVGKLRERPLPHIAIPTTAGTGSEATQSTVVTTPDHFKAAVLSPYLYPSMAILDPLLTLSLPPHITASTGMDALTHAIESYISKQATPITQALALRAVHLIHQHLSTCYFVGDDVESREQMLIASLLAGMAFSQSRLGNVHAISHTFGGVFNIAHGIANATLLPFVLKFNIPACEDKIADISRVLGKDTLEWVQSMNQKMSIPDNIKDLGVTLDVLPKLVTDAMRSGNVLVNPRKTTAVDIQQIIEDAYHGII
jgi:alcohol dehydrogenase class IV